MTSFKDRLAKGVLKRLAKGTSKEAFLAQLKEEWRKQLPVGGGGIKIDEIVDGSMQRIEKSGLKDIFDTVGITREDLVQALKEVLKR